MGDKCKSHKTIWIHSVSWSTCLFMFTSWFMTHKSVFLPRNLPKELPSCPLPCTLLGRSHPPSPVGRLVGHPSQSCEKDNLSGLVVHPVANQQLKVAEPGQTAPFHLEITCCCPVVSTCNFPYCILVTPALLHRGQRHPYKLEAVTAHLFREGRYTRFASGHPWSKSAPVRIT